jgi:thiazole/oxazole-forming peptide maturase SagC family component
MGVKDILVLDDPLLRNTRYFTKAGKIRSNMFDAGTSIVSWKHFLNNEINTRCIIATSEFGGQGCLLPWNAWAIRHGSMFAPVYLQDMVGYLGPLVIPGETACLHCLRMRQNAHLHDAAFEREKEENLLRGESIAAIHPAMITVVAETVVFELCHFFGALPGPRPGRHIKIDMTRAVTAQKLVLKIPRCPVCSNLVTSGTIQLEKPSPIPE